MGISVIQLQLLTLLMTDGSGGEQVTMMLLLIRTFNK